MVILVNPMWSVKNLNKDSNYVHIKKIINRYSKLYPDTYFIIPFPVKHFYYTEDGFFDSRHVIRIPYQIPLAKKINNISFDAQFYQDVIEKYCVGLIYNQIPEVTGQLKSLDSHFSSTIPVVNQHHYIYHDSLPYPLKNQMQYVYWQILGDALADVNIYNSSYTEQMVFENTAKYMPDFKKQIQEKSKIIKFGLYNEDEIVQNKRFEKFTFLYNHRLQQYKNWETTFDVFDKLYEDYDFEVAICPVGSDKLSVVNKKPYTKIYEVPTQADYYNILSKCHANTFNSQYETFCISIFESMMHGLATIVPNSTTMPELLGQCNEQMFNDTNEQISLLKRLLESKSLYKGWGQHNQERAKTFSIDRYCKKLHSVFEEQFTKQNFYESLRSRNKKKLNEYLDKYSKLTNKDIKKIRRFINLSNQSVPNHRLANIMYHSGYIQKIERNETLFERIT